MYCLLPKRRSEYWNFSFSKILSVWEIRIWDQAKRIGSKYGP
jgi:hypothetical protein